MGVFHCSWLHFTLNAISCSRHIRASEAEEVPQLQSSLGRTSWKRCLQRSSHLIFVWIIIPLVYSKLHTMFNFPWCSVTRLEYVYCMRARPSPGNATVMHGHQFCMDDFCRVCCCFHSLVFEYPAGARWSFSRFKGAELVCYAYDLCGVVVCDF